jgi:hypothetical protein
MAFAADGVPSGYCAKGVDSLFDQISRAHSLSKLVRRPSIALDVRIVEEVTGLLQALPVGQDLFVLLG